MAVFLHKVFFKIGRQSKSLFQTRTRKEKSMAYKALAAQGQSRLH
jgi:hypothetical protein